MRKDNLVSVFEKDKGVWLIFYVEFIFDIWDKTFDVSKFKMPGPKVWTG